MPNCPECETPLDFEVDEVEEGDIVACDECGTEYEVVGTEPIELAHVDGDDSGRRRRRALEEEEEED
jgi:alpha-aminoadipate carrier protein LysW